MTATSSTTRSSLRCGDLQRRRGGHRFSAVLICLIVALFADSPARGAGKTAPVWLVSNGFHTSVGLRVKDVPFAAQIVGDPRADKFLLGWGAADFYRGRTNPWTFCKAVVWSPSLLHIVPVRGVIGVRFPRSDIVQLDLSGADFRKLVGELERAFARDASGRLQSRGRGYYPDSRFYASRDHFYFPNMCNTWLAAKLRRGGVRICVPLSLMAPQLVGQAAKVGVRLQRRGVPADAF